MKIAATLIAFTLLAAASGGCSSNSVSYGSITSDLTPELKSLSESPKEYHNNFAVANNADLRMFWDDVAHVFLFNSPSKLSAYPVTSLTGQPR